MSLGMYVPLLVHALGEDCLSSSMAREMVAGQPWLLVGTIKDLVSVDSPKMRQIFKKWRGSVRHGADGAKGSLKSCATTGP